MIQSTEDILKFKYGIEEGAKLLRMIEYLEGTKENLDVLINTLKNPRVAVKRGYHLDDGLDIAKEMEAAPNVLLDRMLLDQFDSVDTLDTND